MVYGGGLYPTILQGEGYVQSFCMGNITTPGSLPIPYGGIRSAHVIRGASKNGKRYIQISGTLDCEALQINCTASSPGAYDGNITAIFCSDQIYRWRAIR